jgi:hypothetical protein
MVAITHRAIFFLGFGMILLVLQESAFARITRSWTYQQMFDKADLVVIGDALTTKDTNERTLIEDIKVIGVTTEFRSALILKGPKTVKAFQLHHYRYEFERDEAVVDSPNLVRIGPNHPAFLLFLVKEADGRYAPVTGQTDPAVISVLRINGTAVGD